MAGAGGARGPDGVDPQAVGQVPQHLHGVRVGAGIVVGHGDTPAASRRANVA